jgi:uncharacterized OsmC-like protein
MKSEELKAVQAPLKEGYRENPASAVVTMRAEGDVEVVGQACTLKSFAGVIRAGLHEAAGGSGAEACSGELLLESLVACAGVTLSAVATNMGLAIRCCRIIAEGDMDFRGTLGIDKNVPVGLSSVRLIFQVDSDLDDAALNKLISLTERYCVIYQTLLKGVPAITTSIAQSTQP